MKKLIIFLALMLISSPVFAANKYARAVGGNWNTDATWSTTDGGGADTTKPTSSDDVFLTATSGNVTIDAAASAKSLTCTGYTGTLTHNSSTTLTVSGSITLSSGMTYSLASATTSAMAINATGSLTSSGKTIGNLTISVGTITIVDNLTAAIINLSSGTLKTDGASDNSGLTHTFDSITTNNSNTRTLTLGNSNITLTATGTCFNAGTITGYTVNAGTSIITCSGATPVFTGNIKTYYDLILSGSGAATINSTSSSSATAFHSVTRTGTASKSNSLVLQSPITVTGTLTINGNSTVNRVLVRSDVLGTSRTITNSGATMSWSNVDFRDITLETSYDCSAISGLCGDAGGNSGITFTTSATQTWQGTSGGNWSDNTKWTSRVPLPQDDVVISSAFSSSQTITDDMPRLGRSIDFSGMTGTSFTFVLGSGVSPEIYGSLILSSNINTFTVTTPPTFMGRSSYTLNSGGKSFSTITISMIGGTMTLAADLTVSGGTTTVTNGTFDASSYNLNSLGFTGSGTGTRSIKMGSGTWTMTGSGGRWTMTTTTNLTWDAGTSTLIYNTSSSGTFQGGGLTYNNVSITATGTTTIAGSNTFNNLSIGAGKTVAITAGTTQTISSLTATGTSSNKIILSSSSAGSAATLSDTTGTNVCTYCTIQDSTATGGATWNAPLSTNVSNNSGWNFYGNSQLRGQTKIGSGRIK